MMKLNFRLKSGKLKSKLVTKVTLEEMEKIVIAKKYFAEDGY